MLIEIIQKSDELLKADNGLDCYIVMLDGKQKMYVYDSLDDPTLLGSFSDVRMLHHIFEAIYNAADRFEKVEIQFKRIE